MGSSVQVIYLDVLLLSVGANFLFDWLLLWATAEVTKTATTRLRLLSGALLGSVHYTLYLLAAYGVVSAYGLLRFPGTVGVVSLAMLAVAFTPRGSASRLFRLAGTFYVILFLSAGAGFAVGNLLAYGGTASPVAVQMGAIGALLLVAEVGWGVVQRRIWRGLYLVPIEITFGAQTIHVMALVDTGNRLSDPITRTPVIVVEFEVLSSLFPEGVRDDIAELVRGDFGRVSGLMAHSTWSSRIRLIPFTSLGAENGLLVGFKPDSVRIMLPQIVGTPRRAVIGLAQHTLDREGQYHALLHPSLLDASGQASEYTLGDADAKPHPMTIQSN